MLKSAGVRQPLDDRRIVDIENLMYDGQVVVRDALNDVNQTGFNHRGNNNSRLSQNTISPNKAGYGGYQSNTGVGASKYGTNENGGVGRRRMLGAGIANGQGQREIDRLERLEQINGKNRFSNNQLGGNERESSQQVTDGGSVTQAGREGVTNMLRRNGSENRF